MWERLPLIPEQASTFASKVDLLYYSLVGFSVFFSVLVFSLIFYFAVRFRRRNDEEHRPDLSKGNLKLEIVWTAIPSLMPSCCLNKSRFGCSSFTGVRKQMPSLYPLRPVLWECPDR